jgi:Protein of unknown function (DUF3375)
VKTTLTSARYKALRGQPTWRLLAADNSPFILGFFQVHFTDQVRRHPASVLVDRLQRDLVDARNEGFDLPQAAQHYLQAWVREGWLERHFPEGAREEEFELSAAAAAAMQMLSPLVEPRRTTTESRLAVVIQQLTLLASETNPDAASRIAALRLEQERIAKEISRLQAGEVVTMPTQKALERAREIIHLASDLTADFRQVRDEFEQLNQSLRKKFVDSDGSRGSTLGEMFDGVEDIRDSDAGKTFSAFWSLLTHPEQNATLEQAIDDILARDFVDTLQSEEKRFLRLMTRNLLAQGTDVHDVLQNFARNLKTFVQSREYLEQRQLNRVLKETQRYAVELKEHVKPPQALPFNLTLSTSNLSSLGQWGLYDPTKRAPAGGMTHAESAPVDLDSLQRLVALSEIDFRTLKSHLRELLANTPVVTIGQALEVFPAEQGLASVIGYLHLGSRHGAAQALTESVHWQELDGSARRAKIPLIYFTAEAGHGL